MINDQWLKRRSFALFIFLLLYEANEHVILSAVGAKDLLFDLRSKAGPSLRALSRAPLRMTTLAASNNKGEKVRGPASLGDFFSRERVTLASSRRYLHPHPVRPHATRDPRYPLDPPPYLHPNHNRHHHQSPRNRRSRAGPKWHRRPGRVGARLGERGDLWGQGGRTGHRGGCSDVGRWLLPPGEHPRGSAHGRGPPARVRSRFRPGRDPRRRYSDPPFRARPRRGESRERRGARLAAPGRDEGRGARGRAERAQHRLRALGRRNPLAPQLQRGGSGGSHSRYLARA